jgi:hypothetical protein
MTEEGKTTNLTNHTNSCFDSHDSSRMILSVPEIIEERMKFLLYSSFPLLFVWFVTFVVNILLPSCGFELKLEAKAR